jgi:hypothetical protein
MQDMAQAYKSLRDASVDADAHVAALRLLGEAWFGERRWREAVARVERSGAGPAISNELAGRVTDTFMGMHGM